MKNMYIFCSNLPWRLHQTSTWFAIIVRSVFRIVADAFRDAVEFTVFATFHLHYFADQAVMLL